MGLAVGPFVHRREVQVFGPPGVFHRQLGSGQYAALAQTRRARRQAGRGPEVEQAARRFSRVSTRRQPVAYDIGDNQRAVCGIPQQDIVCLYKSQQSRHGRGAGGDHVLLIILRDQHELEAAVISVASCDPVGVYDFHSPRLLARARHRSH